MTEELTYPAKESHQHPYGQYDGTFSEQLDRELEAMIAKYGWHEKPEIPDCIKFPFMMVFHRKKVSSRNNNYLVAMVINTLADLCSINRNLTHKGWPTMTLMFDLPEWMADIYSNRYIFWKYNNWDEIERILSESDKLLLPDLKELYPCPASQVRDKKGQYKLIF